MVSRAVNGFVLKQFKMNKAGNTNREVATVGNTSKGTGYTREDSIFINDGTPGGTVKLERQVVGNSNYELSKITNTYNGNTVVKATNKVTGEIHSFKNFGNAQTGNGLSITNTNTSLVPFNPNVSTGVTVTAPSSVRTAIGSVGSNLITSGNSNYELSKITNTYNGNTVVKATNKVTGEIYSFKNFGNAQTGNSLSVTNANTSLVPLNPNVSTGVTVTTSSSARTVTGSVVPNLITSGKSVTTLEAPKNPVVKPVTKIEQNIETVKQPAVTSEKPKTVERSRSQGSNNHNSNKESFNQKRKTGENKSDNGDLYYEGRKVYTASELNQLGRGSNATPNRGVEYIFEKPAGKPEAQEFQWGTTGSMMQQTPDGPKNVIPALRYDNPNSRGMNFIKFDGIEVRDGTTYLIDAKRNVPHWNKSAMKNLTKTFDRINEAKNQNPEIKVIYEFPGEKAKGHFDKWLENNKFYEDTIDEIRIRK